MYDYIVVGGGSAGCVVANRLSANPAHKVLLLEAGPEDKSPLIHVPSGVIGMVGDTKHNWNYDTTAEAELDNRELFWPRGKTLGGSSSINAMVYIRGHRADYDSWAAAGNTGWSYDELLPLFKDLEDNSRGADDYHGTGGELGVTDLRWHNSLSDTFVEAAEQAGYPRNNDFNGATQEGVGIYQVTQRNGERCSSAKAFIAPIREARSNLTVSCNAQVNRVLFDGKRAVGVEYVQDGQTMEARCSGEVILSGGAINSPQLLLLSGIGPKAELERHGIEQRHELPGVGENLQDHLDYIVVVRSRTRLAGGFNLLTIPRLLLALWQYVFGRAGLLTSNIAEAGGFLRSGDDVEQPDLQLHFVPAMLEDHGRKKLFGYGYSLHVCHLYPRSRGRIGLNSADPAAPPSIEPHYLSHPDDLERMLAGVRAARNILGAPAFDAHRLTELYPGSEQHSDDDLRRSIRARAETVYHPVGSCKMGNDPMAVVDDQLRVHGLQGLRVADASIMPTILGGNTNAPSMVIGEKCARMVLAAAQPQRTADAAAA